MAKKTKKNNKLAALIRKHREMRENPEESSSVFSFSPTEFAKEQLPIVVPALGGYAVTAHGARFLSRKLGFLQNHALPAASLAVGGVLYFVAHKLDSLRKHHEFILAGTTIALLQTFLATYFPALSWLIASPGAGPTAREMEQVTKTVNAPVSDYPDLDDEDLAGQTLSLVTGDQIDDAEIEGHADEEFEDLDPAWRN